MPWIKNKISVMEIVNNFSSAIFVIVRMISLALTVMTFHLGFAHQPEVDWNTSKTRIFALCVVSLIQVIFVAYSGYESS